MDNAQLFTILVNGGTFIAAFAALAAALIMYRVTKKFGSGVLASGFKTISLGVLIIAFGMMIDALNSYFVLSQQNIFTVGIFLIKGICFVAGTYIIVIGSKQTADRLENLTK